MEQVHLAVSMTMQLMWSRDLCSAISDCFKLQFCSFKNSVSKLCCCSSAILCIILHTPYIQSFKRWCWFEITILPYLDVKYCVVIVIIIQRYPLWEEISHVVVCLCFLLVDQHFWVRQGLVPHSVSMLHFAGIHPVDSYDTLELFNCFRFFFFSVGFYKNWDKLCSIYHVALYCHIALAN